MGRPFSLPRSQAIKEAISDALWKGLGELDVFLILRSALLPLYSLLARQKAVAEIRDFIKSRRIKVHMHWIKAQIDYACNEHANALIKEAACRHTVDVQIPLS